MLLVILIYSVLGVYLFADIKWNEALNNDANFTTIGKSFLVLIRITTGEKWPELMRAVSRQNEVDYKCLVEFTYDDYIANGSKIRII